MAYTNYSPRCLHDGCWSRDEKCSARQSMGRAWLLIAGTSLLLLYQHFDDLSENFIFQEPL